jgi:hypothetical protein
MCPEIPAVEYAPYCNIYLTGGEDVEWGLRGHD